MMVKAITLLQIMTYQQHVAGGECARNTSCSSHLAACRMPCSSLHMQLRMPPSSAHAEAAYAAPSFPLMTDPSVLALLQLPSHKRHPPQPVPSRLIVCAPASPTSTASRTHAAAAAKLTH